MFATVAGVVAAVCCDVDVDEATVVVFTCETGAVALVDDDVGKGSDSTGSKSTPNCTSKLKLVVPMSGMITADLGILVEGGGGFTLPITIFL